MRARFSSCWRIRLVSIFKLLVAFFPIQNLLLAAVASLPSLFVFVNVLDVVLLYAVFIYWLGRRLLQRFSWRVTPLDGLFLLLGCSIALSTVLNNAFSLDAFQNVFVLLRYVAVYYLAANVAILPSERAVLREAIIRWGQFLSICALVVYLLPGLNDAVDAFLMPTIGKAKKVGSVRLAFSTEVELAAFLLIALILYLFAQDEKRQVTRRSSLLLFVRVFLFLCAIFTTYKRSFFITSFGILGLFWIRRERDARARVMKALTLTGVGVLVVLTAMLLPLWEEFAPLWKWDVVLPLRPRLEGVPTVLLYIQLFSEEYWRRTFGGSRGWSLVTFVPRFIESPYWLMGAGPDESTMRTSLAAVHLDLQRLLVYRGFEDVYWVAVLAYYGVAGLSLLWCILGMLYSIARRVVVRVQNEQERVDGKAFRMIVLVFFLLGFVVRLPELANASFLFWLYAGLVTGSFMRLRPGDNKR